MVYDTQKIRKTTLGQNQNIIEPTITKSRPENSKVSPRDQVYKKMSHRDTPFLPNIEESDGTTNIGLSLKNLTCDFLVDDCQCSTFGTEFYKFTYEKSHFICLLVIF